MSQQPPQRPNLPDDHLMGTQNLLQYVRARARHARDEAIRAQMDVRVLYVLGMASWTQAELYARITLDGDPDSMLVSGGSQVVLLGADYRSSRTSNDHRISVAWRVSGASTTIHLTRSHHKHHLPMMYVFPSSFNRL